MLLSSALLALASSQAASAFMLPPDVPGTESSGGDDNSIETLAVDAFTQTVTLKCPGCAVASGENTLEWTQGVGTSYTLDFEVGKDLASLDISGVRLYPPSFSPFSQPFTVTQVDPVSKNPLLLRVTGYTFHYNSAETISEAGTELLPMSFRITSIESQAVSPPALAIFLLKDTAGRLMLASIKPDSSLEKQPTEKKPSMECSKEWSTLCKWKSIVTDKLEKVKTAFKKGCHKSKQTGHGKPHGQRPGRPHHRPHHSQDEEEHHAHRHHHHHHSKGLGRARWFLFTIIFPVIVGIFAGAFTYIIGMMVGSVIALLWAKFRGVNPGDYESIAQNDADETSDGKMSDKEVYCGLTDYEGEAPPLYVEATEKEVVSGSE